MRAPAVSSTGAATDALARRAARSTAGPDRAGAGARARLLVLRLGRRAGPAPRLGDQLVPGHRCSPSRCRSGSSPVRCSSAALNLADRFPAHRVVAVCGPGRRVGHRPDRAGRRRGALGRRPPLRHRGRTRRGVPRGDEADDLVVRPRSGLRPGRAHRGPDPRQRDAAARHELRLAPVARRAGDGIGVGGARGGRGVGCSCVPGRWPGPRPRSRRGSCCPSSATAARCSPTSATSATCGSCTRCGPGCPPTSPPASRHPRASRRGARWWGSRAFTVIGLAGVVGCLGAGRLGDRLGRARVAGWAMRVSASCCVLAAVVFGLSPWVVAPVLLVWGVSVIADSGLFSSCVADVVDPRYVGTALTTQTAIGFLLTVVTINAVPVGGRRRSGGGSRCCCSRSGRRPGRWRWHGSTSCCGAPGRSGSLPPARVRSPDERCCRVRLRATWTRFRARMPCRTVCKSHDVDAGGGCAASDRPPAPTGPARGDRRLWTTCRECQPHGIRLVVQDSGSQGPAVASRRSCGGTGVHRRPPRRPHQPRARRGLRHRDGRARPRLRQAGAGRRARAVRRRAPRPPAGSAAATARPTRPPSRSPPSRPRASAGSSCAAGPAPAPARSAATASTPSPSRPRCA